MNLNKINAIFIVSFAFIISGCAKQQEVDNVYSTPIVLSELFDARDKVKEYIKYKEYDSKNECSIRLEDKSTYCVNIDSAIVSVENGSRFIYAVENGVELDENKEKMTAHVNYGSLKFFRFEISKDNKIKLLSESDLLSCGPYGGTCSAVTYRYGSGPELAWVLSTGDVHQGYSGTNLSAYAAFGKKIISFLDIQTSYSNENAVRGDEPDAIIQDISTKIITEPRASDKFFDLKVYVTGTEIKKKKKTAIDFSTVVKFDSKNNAYVTDEVKKIYEGKDY